MTHFPLRRTLLTGLALLLACLLPSPGLSAAEENTTADLVIYGGTSAGIAAAVQAKRLGLSVIVIEPTNRIGGLTTGGLGQTDIGNKAAIGGIAREFYRAIAQHYENPEAWRWQKREEYRSGGQSKTARGESAMWTFEPSAALSVYEAWVKRDELRIVYGQRLDRTAVLMTRSRPARIIGIRMESGETYRAKMFIDATYEGDLLAAAGVSYTVGREANAKYGETLNGVQTKMAKHHQLKRGVDPYVTPGDRTSGLLPHIDPNGPGTEGEADRRVQAYCFRMCLTDHPENRIPFAKPEGYRPEWYELLLRNYEAGETAIPWANSPMPNRKTDTNNRTGFSTDFIGQNYDYPEGTYAEREAIVAQHRLYQQGLMWTLANHPRVPERVRREVSRWGTCRDEFDAENGWQQQLYIREARRMVSDYVMTQQNCQGLDVEDPIGLAAYTMDSHNVQRHVNVDGHARNEGDVQVGGFSPYGISYRSIVPKREEVSNLLVPVCLSASHIAFGSIRMEPVFMVLGQSSATAAWLAIEENTSVQNIDYEQLAKQLRDDGQLLEWTGPKAKPGIDPKTIEGVVIDETDAKTEGGWVNSRSTFPFVGRGYLHDNNTSKGDCTATFTFRPKKPGRYRIELRFSPFENRATNTPVTISTGTGSVAKRVNQRDPKSKGIVSLGEYNLDTGAVVTIGNADTDGFVIADAVVFVPLADTIRNPTSVKPRR